ncbi:MAG TPA: hypothetical protein VHC50_00240, partial [Puia sp.]|nr:hypothetical protein [Puia sp.]
AFYIILSFAICVLACRKQMPIHPPTNPVDSATKKPGDSIRNPIDTTKKPGDSTKNPIDSTIETQPPVLLGITDSINSDIGGFYVGLPTKYKTSGKKYPLLFFMCGAGVYGNGASDLPKMLKEALPLLLKQKTFPPDFLVNGQHFSFIIMAPQFKVYPDNPNIIMDALTYAKANYPIDPSRIYLTGISNGSEAGGYLAAAYPSMFAATVPIAGIELDTPYVQNMVNANLPVWAFHNNDDEKVDVNTTKDFISVYNSMHPAIPARLTLFAPYGTLNHDAWTKAMNPAYKEDGKNMYEWMLQYSR